MHIAKSKEFDRIAALPRRQWQANAPAIAKAMTAELRKPGGDMELFPVQGQALHEARQEQGAFLPIGVGQGKALISVLAPTVLKAERPVLIVPASMQPQTIQQVLPEMHEQWPIHKDLYVSTYPDLSNKHKAQAIFERNHDVWVFDEAHHLKDLNAGRTRRLLQHMHKHPDVRVVAMSGTMANRSIMEFWHLLILCLKFNAPIPMPKQEAMQWGDAVDEIKAWKVKRPHPGALLTLAPPLPQESPIEHARRAFTKRLHETPGVVNSSDKDSCEASILVNLLPIDIGDDLRGAIKKVQDTWEDPQGDVLMQAVDVWRICRDLGLGFYYKWKYPAPREWLAARKAYHKFVQTKLQYQRTLYQTPGDVFEHQGEMSPDKQAIEYKTWVSVKDIFRPDRMAYWLSDTVLHACHAWLKKHKQICWVEQIEFGEKLSALSGYPYYGSDDQHHADVLRAQGPIICSIGAHGTGKNFQDRYNQNLVSCSPSTGKCWEQLIGRTHRSGQKNDEVIFDVLQPNDAHKNCFAQARSDADWSVSGKQKLSIATITTIG